MDLTTDGLWAAPLNEGWVPVKARRLQDWEKLKKYVSVHKQGDVCPNGSQPCLKKAMAMTTMLQNKDDSTVQCIVCVHHPMPSSVLKNVTTHPLPPTHTFLKWPFLTDFKNMHTSKPPLCDDMFAHQSKTGLKNPKKCSNTQSWQILNVPDRYATCFLGLFQVALSGQDQDNGVCAVWSKRHLTPEPTSPPAR